MLSRTPRRQTMKTSLPPWFWCSAEDQQVQIFDPSTLQSPLACHPLFSDTLPKCFHPVIKDTFLQSWCLWMMLPLPDNVFNPKWSHEVDRCMAYIHKLLHIMNITTRMAKLHTHATKSVLAAKERKRTSKMQANPNNQHPSLLAEASPALCAA